MTDGPGLGPGLASLTSVTFSLLSGTFKLATSPTKPNEYNIVQEIDNLVHLKRYLSGVEHADRPLQWQAISLCLLLPASHSLNAG